MHALEEFLKHASECEVMAEFTRDPQSRATWRGMADRWRRCAEIAKRQSSRGNRHEVPFRLPFKNSIVRHGYPGGFLAGRPHQGGRNSRGEDQALFTEIGDAPPKRHSRCVPASGRSVPGSTDHDHKPNISSHADSNGAHMDAAG